MRRFPVHAGIVKSSLSGMNLRSSMTKPCMIFPLIAPTFTLPEKASSMNWLISATIYAIVCGLMVFILIGIPLLVVLAGIGVVFCIIGGLKANNGEVWQYPLSIKFFKIEPDTLFTR
jgi:hypothetical protein